MLDLAAEMKALKDRTSDNFDGNDYAKLAAKLLPVFDRALEAAKTDSRIPAARVEKMETGLATAHARIDLYNRNGTFPPRGTTFLMTHGFCTNTGEYDRQTYPEGSDVDTAVRLITNASVAVFGMT